MSPIATLVAGRVPGVSFVQSKGVRRDGQATAARRRPPSRLHRNSAPRKPLKINPLCFVHNSRLMHR